MNSRRQYKPPPPDFGPERRDPKCKEFEANNLRHPKFFPAYKHCAPYKAYSKKEENPPSHHWCYLGEIVEDESSPIRVVLGVKDKDGEYVRVAFYFDDKKSFDFKNVKIGSTIAVMYGEKHYFLDGSYGLRLEHPKFVKIFPCKLETLLRISDDIESETPVDSAQKCRACGKEEHPDKISLLRCSRCLGASYCGKECQTNAWNAGHKRECKVFAAVKELKSSRDWRSWKFTGEPLEWVAFGQRESGLVEKELRPVGPDYRPNPEWKDAKPAVVTELQGTFIVTSGELIWGQLASLLEGLVNPGHDLPTPDHDKAEASGTILTQGYTYRAPAKIGVWKLAKVNGYGFADTPKDSWIAYHSSYGSPLELLLLARSVSWETRTENPRVCWVNRYDWGTHCAKGLWAAHTFAEIDPESGWPAANERYKRLAMVDKYSRAGHPDYDRWERLSEYDSHNIFLVDAAHGAEVLKVLARPSDLDAHIAEKKSTSFFASEGDKESFGCNLAFIGEEWEFARLIFGEGESEKFPGEKELVGFWYDADNRYNDSEMDFKRKLEEPTFDII